MTASIKDRSHRLKDKEKAGIVMTDPTASQTVSRSSNAAVSEMDLTFASEIICRPLHRIQTR